MLFAYQIVKGYFPTAAAAYAPGCVYGSVANDNPAKGIVRVSDMLLIFFVVKVNEKVSQALMNF